MTSRYNYIKLMSRNPYKHGSIGTEDLIDLYEHPTYGEDSPVIAVQHERQLAWDTGFYDPWESDSDQEIIIEQMYELLEDLEL